MRFDFATVIAQHFENQPALVRQASNATGQTGLHVKQRRHAFDNAVVMFLRGEQHHVAEHVEGLHDANGIQAFMLGFQYVFLDKQLLAFKVFCPDPRGINVKAKALIDMVMLAPRH